MRKHIVTFLLVILSEAVGEVEWIWRVARQREHFVTLPPSPSAPRSFRCGQNDGRDRGNSIFQPQKVVACNAKIFGKQNQRLA